VETILLLKPEVTLAVLEASGGGISAPWSQFPSPTFSRAALTFSFSRRGEAERGREAPLLSARAAFSPEIRSGAGDRTGTES
jgi:hypothetical protein